MLFRGWFSALLSWFFEDFAADLDALRHGGSLSLETPQHAKAPSRQRCVALAGVHMYVSVNILSVAVDDVFPVEYIILVKWIVRLKAVSIDDY